MYSSKTRSFALLIGLTTGIVFATKPNGPSDKPFSGLIRTWPGHDTTGCCQNACCDLCTTERKDLLDCCTDCTQILCFEALLSFEQTFDPETKLPRTSKDAPPKNICGTFKLCFDKLFTQACYRLTICGADGKNNPNERVMTAILFNVGACEPVTLGDGGNTTIIFPFIFGSLDTDSCGTSQVPLCKTACITNVTRSGQNGPVPLSIACLYQFALNGKLKLAVAGTDCASYATDYSFEKGGLLAGTLRPCMP